MSEMIPFRYGGFWDVPRYIALRYGGKVLYLQSPFDDELDDYPDAYSVYVVPDDMGESLLSGDWNPLDQSRLSLVGQIPINTVAFDPSKMRHVSNVSSRRSGMNDRLTGNDPEVI